MSDIAAGAVVGDPGDRQTDLENRIIAFIQKEIQDKSAVLTRDTRRDQVTIDSIDVVNVVFAVEEAFDIEVNLMSDAKFDTVGDLVDALIAFIPEEKRRPT
jgi:acyl carrier protein